MAKSALGTAGVALAAALLGSAPSVSVAPQLAASLHYLPGTRIGYLPGDAMFGDFIGRVVDGVEMTPPDLPYEKVGYSADFWPISHGGFRDQTFNRSVRQGVALLEAQAPAAGDVIFGFSQGAVVASRYKQTHAGHTYLLVANPNRPNGGILSRFKGITIPILDFTFDGPTPANGDPTYDIVRQYDGWADFPTYLWNPIALANAIMGIVLVHGNTQMDLTAADLEATKQSGDPDHYQFHAGSNTHYYVVKTYPVPLLMPLTALLPASVIAALDAPLRKFIELAYDRSDYSEPARARFFAPLKPFGRVEAVAAEPDVIEGSPPVSHDESGDRRGVDVSVEKGGGTVEMLDADRVGEPDIETSDAIDDGAASVAEEEVREAEDAVDAQETGEADQEEGEAEPSEGEDDQGSDETEHARDESAVPQSGSADEPANRDATATP
ncbi:PE-PPE domain-containing protein [Mycobacterium sp. ITM-2016-00317]|uniref:PE-PPE domain-containing protein n=1 Tax=Mycobacterium sp. ITM-2016-00317 TaxID=2099694 RepID=UPI00287FC0DA|nr:PE-PPE domain-containing protein [Mycobacterium sp. ITM-2016-00317]WNG88452.1 PE-PPE domain-containing protein [Mycobacterium sp. ITM-2016-00317]